MLVHPVFHVSLLKPVAGEPEHVRKKPGEQPPMVLDGDAVDAISDHKETRKGIEYSVKWLDGSTAWEREAYLANAQEPVRK